MDTVGLNVLVRDSGETPRTLQHWSDLGILKPIVGTHKQGRGYHREFDASMPWQSERTWTLIASELNRLRVPLGDIKLIIEDFRGMTTELGTSEEPKCGWDKVLAIHPVGSALLGHFVMIVVGIDATKNVRWATVLEKESSKSIVSSHKSKGRMHDVSIELKLPWNFAAKYSSSYLLNLTEILRPIVQPK